MWGMCVCVCVNGWGVRAQNGLHEVPRGPPVAPAAPSIRRVPHSPFSQASEHRSQRTVRGTGSPEHPGRSLFLPPSPPSFSTPTHCHRAGASLHDPPCPPLGPRPPFAVPRCVASPPPRHLPAPPAGCRGCSRHCQEKVRRSSAGLHPRRESEKRKAREMRVSRVFMTPTLTRNRSTAAFEKRENPDDDNGIRF